LIAIIFFLQIESKHLKVRLEENNDETNGLSN